MNEQQTSKELLPCPFCGGTPEIDRAGTSRYSTIIVCTNCGCRHESGDEGSRVGRSWNERHAHEPGTARVQRLEAFHSMILAGCTDEMYCGPHPADLWSTLIGECQPCKGSGVVTDGAGKTVDCTACGSSGSAQPPPVGPLTLDTDQQVFFYEQDHYYLSNFSAFAVKWAGWTFPTSEHAYHWEKFPGRECEDIRFAIRTAVSAHGAFKTAEAHKADRRPDWDDLKAEIMLRILREKARQHEYVRRKLLQTGDRELIENSWRDDVWGWGPNRDGQNLLGKLWMQVREELRASALTKRNDP